MGYEAHGGGPLIIMEDNFQNIVEALRDRFDWMQANDIDRAFEEWGFEVDFENGNIAWAWFEENRWNADVDDLFETIAPYVENGSHMDFTGEDGSMWRCSFYNKQYIETNGEVIYPGDPYFDREGR